MTVDDEAACRALYDELVAGWNEGSGARFAAAFAEDGELVAFDGSRLQGRATIEAFHQELFDKWMKGTRLTGGVDDVKMLGPDVAVMHAIGGTIKRARRRPRPGLDQTLTLKRTEEAGGSPRSRTPHPPDRQQLLAFLHWTIGDALCRCSASTDPTAHVRTSTPQPVAAGDGAPAGGCRVTRRPPAGLPPVSLKQIAVDERGHPL